MKDKLTALERHHESFTRLYGIWKGIKRRCRGTDKENAKYYSEKGITVCAEWAASYTAFRCWALANGYSDTLTIDRVDNNGNYTPQNCRWVDRKTQNRNFSRNRNITAFGETKTLAEWCESLKINRKTTEYRINHGWKHEDALTFPVMSFKEVGKLRKNRRGRYSKLTAHGITPPEVGE